MSTCYTISLGYDSKGKGSWQWLKETVLAVTPDQLEAEYLKYDTIIECEDGCCTLRQFAEHYRNCSDLTLIIDDENHIVQQFASGAGLQRIMKEGLRRAMCRLILHAAHSRQLEINIEVA